MYFFCKVKPWVYSYVFFYFDKIKNHKNILTADDESKYRTSLNKKHYKTFFYNLIIAHFS